MSELERHLTAQSENFGNFFWHRLRWKAVSEYFPAHRDFDLLDIGAGAGHFGTFLSTHFPRARYHFVEPIAALEERLVSRFGASRDAAHRPDYGDMDIVTLLDVLEHQEHDVAFLADVVERCRPGATLVLTVPALMTLWSSWDVALGHYRRYDRRELSDVLSRLPLEVLEVNYLFPELVPAGRFRAWRSRRTGSAPDAPEASFPKLPDALNGLLYRLGSPAVVHRRHVPRGSSLIAAARVRAAP